MSPSPRPDAPRETWPPAAKTAAGCGAGCALLVLLQGIGFWLALHFALAHVWPEGLDVSVEAPSPAPVGKPFPVTLVFRNKGSTPVTVGDLAPAERESDVALRDPQPRPASTAGGVWSYGRRLEPGETWRVRFRAEARRAGTLRGAVRVRADALPRVVLFTVRAKAPATSPPRPASRSAPAHARR